MIARSLILLSTLTLSLNACAAPRQWYTCSDMSPQSQQYYRVVNPESARCGPGGQVIPAPPL